MKTTIENINYTGLKKFRRDQKRSAFKSRSSYNEYTVGEEKTTNFFIKRVGYYNSVVNIYVKNKKDNLVDIEINLNLGEKAKTKK